MQTLKTLLIPGALLFLTACSGYQVRYDYDVRAAFASYKTFDWYAASKHAKEEARGVENPLMDRRVRHAIETELAAKGFKLEAKADPDFLVTYYPVYRERAYRTTTYMGWGYRPYWGGGVGTSMSQVHRYQEGTIVIEIVEAKSNQLVWQGAAEGALTGLDNPEDAEEVVGSAVRKLLANFPPQPRG